MKISVSNQKNKLGRVSKALDWNATTMIEIKKALLEGIGEKRSPRSSIHWIDGSSIEISNHSSSALIALFLQVENMRKKIRTKTNAKQ